MCQIVVTLCARGDERRRGRYREGALSVACFEAAVSGINFLAARFETFYVNIGQKRQSNVCRARSRDARQRRATGVIATPLVSSAAGERRASSHRVNYNRSSGLVSVLGFRRAKQYIISDRWSQGPDRAKKAAGKGRRFPQVSFFFFSSYPGSLFAHTSPRPSEYSEAGALLATLTPC
ncbi:hypothetical protein AAFF_G00305840 [Aldrovandia affinis]|uniref:Uncharacterized protein n=1 Tax=Aldrovandia affinis TaxID=143900 RepID=A0AAD7SQE2_9TELE|nr:hypothetical protein AAFF_G00305840 [Aldrovandia affinis]